MPLKPMPKSVGSGESGSSGAPRLEIIEPLCAVFRRTLKGEGLKYTPERARVLDTIIGFDGIFEADRLIERLRSGGHRVSKATVYRTLKLMLEAGIIQRVPIDSDQAHYQLVYGREPTEMIICVDSNRVETISIPEIAALCERICAERGLRPEGHRFTIFATGGA
ncbi:MAG: transcriptional repressor [Phycisphaeraceae bacterium]|nr:transcriptional repressor [Phycisphaeraceae bacterium]